MRCLGCDGRRAKGTMMTTRRRIRTTRFQYCSIVRMTITFWLFALPTCHCFLSSRARTKPTSTTNLLDSKFGFVQRIESIKTLVISSFTGSLVTLPLILSNDSSWSQFEFDTDGAALLAGLFGIVYRYTIREDDNPQLNQGVIGSFVLTRTISKVHVPSYCTAIPLNCGPPLGYLDWELLRQFVAYGVEASVLFGVTALVLDACMERNILSKFPN